MKKNSYLVSIILSLFMIIASGALLFINNIEKLFDNNSVLISLVILMYFYAILKAINYLFVKKTDEYESLLTCMASIIAGTTAIIFGNENISQVIILATGEWLILVALIKLIKITYSKNKNDLLWNIRIVFFFTFVLTGILVSINLYFNISKQNSMIGFLFLISSLIDFVICLIEMLKIKKKVNNEPDKEIEEVKTNEYGAKVLGEIVEVKAANSKIKKPAKSNLKKEIKKSGRKKIVKKKTNIKPKNSKANILKSKEEKLKVQKSKKSPQKIKLKKTDNFKK